MKYILIGSFIFLFSNVSYAYDTIPQNFYNIEQNKIFNLITLGKTNKDDFIDFLNKNKCNFSESDVAYNHSVTVTECSWTANIEFNCQFSVDEVVRNCYMSFGDDEIVRFLNEKIKDSKNSYLFLGKYCDFERSWKDEDHIFNVHKSVENGKYYLWIKPFNEKILNNIILEQTNLNDIKNELKIVGDSYKQIGNKLEVYSPNILTVGLPGRPNVILSAIGKYNEIQSVHLIYVGNISYFDIYKRSFCRKYGQQSKHFYFKNRDGVWSLFSDANKSSGWYSKTMAISLEEKIIKAGNIEPTYILTISYWPLHWVEMFIDSQARALDGL